MADLTLSLADGVGAAEVAPGLAETPGVWIEVQGEAQGRARQRRVTVQQGGRLPVLVFALRDGSGYLYDLDGATVTLYARERESDGDYTIQATCTVLASGYVTYRLAAADVDTAGVYLAEVEMDFGADGVFTSEVFVLEVVSGGV